MRAVTFVAYGGPEVLAVTEVPEPHAGPAEVRVAVRAASVNRWDTKVRSGAISAGTPLAGTGRLGLDAAGVVDEVGEQVVGVAVGDPVFGLGSGAQAEYAVLRAWAPKSEAVDWAVAAASGVAGETAERGLRLLGVQAAPGSSPGAPVPLGGAPVLFVDGGAGGVGAVAVQIAVAAGATVVASGAEANHDYLRSLGAIPVTYGSGVADRVRAAAPAAVTAVFDTAGRTPITELIGLVPDPAQVVTIANFTAAEAGARVSGGGADSNEPAALVLAAGLLAADRLRIEVETYRLDQVAQAHERMEQGRIGRGKLVLLP